MSSGQPSDNPVLIVIVNLSLYEHGLSTEHLLSPCWGIPPGKTQQQNEQPTAGPRPIEAYLQGRKQHKTNQLATRKQNIRNVPTSTQKLIDISPLDTTPRAYASTHIRRDLRTELQGRGTLLLKNSSIPLTPDMIDDCCQSMLENQISELLTLPMMHDPVNCLCEVKGRSTNFTFMQETLPHTHRIRTSKDQMRVKLGRPFAMRY
ncbi:hypothetical protein RHMOL_Rhmol06G0095200 [Rhododendron molle]|uniref:Uncharacterized protein n=1 Tax=Rhododendron molle TaxID=49168 RepID=A0ACC0NAL2_RHOML|nr:hypothetical protein RHMOL_Rhmol06G0095200 [Rhododendron molle]